MTFSPTGSSGLFTVEGTPYTFEVDAQQTDRRTSAAGADHHIPYGSVTYLQSSGVGPTRFALAVHFVTVAEFEAMESAVGQMGTLQTVQDGLWAVARLDDLSRTVQYTDGSVDARAMFVATRSAAPT